MGNEAEELEPGSPEQALDWLLEMQALEYGRCVLPSAWDIEAVREVKRQINAKGNAARAYILKWVEYAQERQGMMRRRELLEAMRDAPGLRLADERILGYSGVLGMMIPGSLSPMQAVIENLIGQAEEQLALMDKGEQEAEADAQ